MKKPIPQFRFFGDQWNAILHSDGGPAPLNQISAAPPVGRSTQ